MTSTNQTPIGKDITLEGRGVHSGEPSSVTLRPAPAGSGLRFRRTDLEGAPEIPATLEHVSGTDMGTSLAAGDAKVLTVEHVLAAARSSGVDNLVVDVAGPEVPIRDGSFRDFYQAFAAAGSVQQDAPAKVIRLPSAVSVEGTEGESYVAAPASGLRISATIEFPHPAIGRQFGSFSLDPEGFARDIAAARTFGFAAEWDTLRARGLALGASLENTVGLGEEGVLNPGLRFPDEFLRHKVGDLAGDLALLGARLEAHVVAERPGHAGNIRLVRALAEHVRRNRREPAVDIHEIMRYLPHRYPMLLVDRVVDFEAGKRIVGIKNVTINEPFFQGHYPGHPIMPGVLLVEAMAQAGGLLLMDAVEDPENKVVYFMSLDNVKWRRPVTPGDTVVFEGELLQFRRGICKMRGVGLVNGQVVTEADLMARVMDR
ncbi:MAG: UDP-3-O-[3-hydroxymyristoyl] N-acetylglucosamine deacetylase [Gemmatimonadetes bacterium]|nr:UDP-3-O-[3-hydroxymyristoyl] N-acetylglucosamine deacetylase [Gemmatimonadota bacterium]